MLHPSKSQSILQWFNALTTNVDVQSLSQFADGSLFCDIVASVYSQADIENPVPAFTLTDCSVLEQSSAEISRIDKSAVVVKEEKDPDGNASTSAEQINEVKNAESSSIKTDFEENDDKDNSHSIEIKKKYDVIKKFIDDFFQIESSTLIAYSGCMEGEDLELAKVAVMLLSAMVQNFLSSYNQALHTITLLEASVQEDIKECLSLLLEKEKELTKTDLQKVLGKAAKYKATSRRITPLRGAPAIETPTSKKRRRGEKVSAIMYEDMQDSPLKGILQSPNNSQHRTAIAMFKKESEISKLRNALHAEEMKVVDLTLERRSLNEELLKKKEENGHLKLEFRKHRETTEEREGHAGMETANYLAQIERLNKLIGQQNEDLKILRTENRNLDIKVSQLEKQVHPKTVPQDEGDRYLVANVMQQINEVQQDNITKETELLECQKKVEILDADAKAYRQMYEELLNKKTSPIVTRAPEVVSNIYNADAMDKLSEKEEEIERVKKVVLNLKNQLKEKTDNMKAVLDKLSSLQEKWEKLLNKAKNCPTCGSAPDSEDLEISNDSGAPNTSGQGGRLWDAASRDNAPRTRSRSARICSSVPVNPLSVEKPKMLSHNSEDLEIPSTSSILNSSGKEVSSAGNALNSSGQEVPSAPSALNSSGQEVPSTSSVLNSSGREVLSTSNAHNSSVQEIAPTSHALNSSGQEVPSTASALNSSGREVPSTSRALNTSGQEVPSAGNALNSSGRVGRLWETAANGNAPHTRSRSTHASSHSLPVDLPTIEKLKAFSRNISRLLIRCKIVVDLNLMAQVDVQTRNIETIEDFITCLENIIRVLKTAVPTASDSFIADMRAFREVVSEGKIMAELEEKANDLKTAVKEIQNLKTQQHATEKENSRLKFEIKKFTKENYRMREHITTIQIEKKKLFKMFQKMRETEKALESQLKKCDGCERHNQKVAEYKKVLHDKEQKVEEMKYFVKDMESQIKSYDRQVKDLKNEKKKLESQIQHHSAFLLGNTTARNALIRKYMQQGKAEMKKDNENEKEDDEIDDVITEKKSRPVVTVNTYILHPERKLEEENMRLVNESSMSSHFGNRSIKSVYLPTEDEEDFLNHSSLVQIQSGVYHDPNATNSKERLHELQRRNTFCPPHLQSSYPLELQNMTPSERKYSMAPRSMQEPMPSTSGINAMKKRKISETDITQPIASKKKILRIGTTRQPYVSAKSRTPDRQTFSIGKGKTFKTPSSIRRLMGYQIKKNKIQ